MSTDSAVDIKRHPNHGRILAENLVINDRVKILASQSVIVIDDSKHGLPTPSSAHLVYDLVGTVATVMPTSHGQIVFLSVSDLHKVIVFMQHKHPTYEM